MASLKVTVACLVSLFVLVFFMTLEQVDLGLYLAQKKYFEFLFVYITIKGVAIPIFPGGLLIGWILFINLVVAHSYRFKISLKKSGIWLTHFGLILLVLGSGITYYFAQESQLVFSEGEKKFFTEDFRDVELVVVREFDEFSEKVVSFSSNYIVWIIFI